MLLSVDDLQVHYGRIAAVRGISLEVGEGEVVALVGQNGAGKTSIMQAIAGRRPASAGKIRLRGEAIDALTPEDRARRGISLVPEGREVFGSLTVEENLRVAIAARSDRAGFKSDLDQVLEPFPILRQRFRSPGKTLSGGEQQQLVIARALMTRPSLLMIDEPSLGLAPQMVDLVYGILADLRRRTGLTLLLVEQSMERVLDDADRVYFIETGLVARLAIAETLRQEHLAAAPGSARQAAWSE